MAGARPIPKKHLDLQACMETWEGADWLSLLEPALADEATRKVYV